MNGNLFFNFNNQTSNFGLIFFGPPVDMLFTVVNPLNPNDKCYL